MPTVRLNDIALRSFKPPLKGQVDFWDNGLPCFGCRVSQGGSKTFLLKHDNRRITLGRYPVIRSRMRVARRSGSLPSSPLGACARNPCPILRRESSSWPTKPRASGRAPSPTTRACYRCIFPLKGSCATLRTARSRTAWSASTERPRSIITRAPSPPFSLTGA
jgi:hypothetical protein